MQPLDSVTFDASGLIPRGERDGLRLWHTPEGDGIGLHYFPIPPDIEADLRSVDAVRAHCRTRTAQVGAAIIEVDVLQIDGCPALRQIIKVPQQQGGMGYIGSIILPFHDFSYVLKIQCLELGTTGFRDAIVLDRMMAAGEVQFDVTTRTMRGWMQDPYDPSIRDVFARNLSEAEEYDEHFPDHPLSRLRGWMRRVQPTLRVGDEVRGEPPFEYAAPQQASTRQQATKPWWKFW